MPSETDIDAVGVVGYGDVGRLVADCALDLGSDVTVTSRSPAALERELSDSPISVASTPADLAAESDLVVSCVWPVTAVETAAAVADELDGDEGWYYDLNSVSPATTRRMADRFEDTGWRFLKGTIRGTVAGSAAGIRLTIAGEDAGPVATYVGEMGFSVKPMGEDVERPAALKMCRSIVTKGLRELTTESLLPASAYGLEADVLADLSSIFEGQTFDEWVRGALVGSPASAERRLGEAHEMADTARDAGYRAPAATAAIDFHRIVHEESIDEETYREILAALAPHYEHER